MNTDKIQQDQICKKFKTNFYPSPDNFKVGISSNLKGGILFPINGLRHKPVGETTGWYIWAGEEYSDEKNYFVPLHVEHLKEWCPEIIKYLGLPPGYRILIGENDYEDVWVDLSIL